MLDNPWMEEDGHQDAEDRSVEVRIVVDTIPRIFRCPYAVPQIKDGEQPGRHGNHKENAQHRLRLEKNKTEQHCTDCPRCAQTVIIHIVAFFKYGTHIADHQAEYVK